MVIGHATNTAPLDHVGNDLRILLADFIMLYHKKGQKQNGHMLWEKMLEYYKWLSVVKYVPDDPNNLYSPCKLIDKMWHFHILYTKNYRATCELLCGQYIDHRPVFEADWERTKRLETSIVAIRQREPFTAYTAKIWNIPLQSPAFNLAAVGKVRIKTLTGRVMEVGYHPKYTIGDLLIKLDLCLTGTRVIFDGHSLDINKTCEEYGIKANATLHSVQNLAGC
jgi:hypothetical protein